MASDVITSAGTIFISFMGSAFRVLIGLGLVLAGATIVYYWMTSKKTNKDYGKIIFKKHFEASKRLGCNSKKKLVLCPIPWDIEKAKEIPYYHINYQPLGDIVGVNLLGSLTDIKDLVKLNENMSEEKIEQIMKENLDPNNDKFWFAFAYERVTGKIPLFSTKIQAILLAKGNQILSLHSKDNIIRVKGLGIYPLGEYELIEDENFKVNINQLFTDQAEIISKEVTLASWSSLGEIVTHSIAADPGFRKMTAIEGVKVQDKPTVTEGHL